jgi:hypothetical protein
MGSGIKDYIRTFFVRWTLAMSGPLSIPLVVAGYFVSNDTARIGLYVSAFICAAFASYWVWKVEREARVAAEEAAKPLANISLINDFVRAKVEPYATNRQCSILVENVGSRNLNNCQVTMAHRNMAEPKYVCAPFSLRPYEPKRIPIINFKDSSKSQSAVAYPWVERAGVWSMSDVRWLLPFVADYTIHILADDIKPSNICIRLDHNDDWIVTLL